MRQTLQGMRALESIDPDLRRAVYRTWRSQFKQIALVNVWRLAPVRAGAQLGIVGFVSAIVLTPFAAAFAIPGHLPLWQWLWVLPLYVLGVVRVATPILGLVSIETPSYRAWLGRSIMISGACVLVVALILAYGRGLPDGIEVLATATLLLQAVVVVYGIFLSLLSGAFQYAGQRVLRRKHPEALVVDALGGILIRLEFSAERWRSLAFKRELMFFLEVAALVLEFDLPRHLKSGDPTTDAWIKERGREWAHALRDRKKTVFAISEEARDELRKAIGAALGFVSLGDWDSLERQAPPAAKDRPRETRVRDALATCLRAAFPGVMLIVLQQTDLALSGTAADYATVAVLAWAALTLLARFDPMFSEKIAALSDVKEFLKPQPPPGGGM